MKALILILALCLCSCVPALGQADTCIIRAGRWSKWSACEWRLMRCSEIARPEGIPVHDTVEWRWVSERTARNRAFGNCGRDFKPGMRREVKDCVPNHLLR